MRRLLTILCCFFSFSVCAQEAPVFELLRSIPEVCTNISVDPLGQLYLINAEGQLKKIRNDGAEMNTIVYNELLRNGKHLHVDVSNPMRPILFYADLGKIILLDQNMRRRNQIELRSKGLYNVTAVAGSYDNALWLYDVQDASIKKMTPAGQLADQTADLRQVLSETPSFTWLNDQGQLLYGYDAQMGLFLFDHYGGLKSRIALLQWEDLSLVGSWLVGRKKNVLQRYNVITKESSVFPLPSSLHGALRVQLTGKYLYAMFTDRVAIYSFKP